MKKSIETIVGVYEIYIEQWQKLNLIGRVFLSTIGVPFFIAFGLSIVVVEAIGPYILNVMEWIGRKLTK